MIRQQPPHGSSTSMDDGCQTISDPQRLQALHATALLDTPAEEAFDRLTSLGARAVQVPAAMVSLISDQRHYLKSICGMAPPLGRTLPFSHSFCRYVVETRAPLVIADARESTLLGRNPAIVEFGVIAYLGMPLTTEDGYIIGAFCVIDHHPRQWRDDEIRLIADLAATTMTEINLRFERDLARCAKAELARAHAEALARLSEVQRLQAELARQQAAAEAVRAKAAMLARSNADLEHFAYLASHDLQEPLRMVTGFINLAQRRSTSMDAQTSGWLTGAADGALRMQRLIQDLLAFARVDSIPRSGLVCDSDAALSEALRILGTKLTLAQGRVEREPLPRVACAHSQLVQLFQNLVANAVKYRGHDQPCIHIRASTSDGTVTFTVADNGIGIEPDLTPHVFDLFCRLPNPESQRGAGLGLAICKRIVERHHGRIWVVSQPGLGSTFHFTLPAAAEIAA